MRGVRVGVRVGRREGRGVGRGGVEIGIGAGAGTGMEIGGWEREMRGGRGGGDLRLDPDRGRHQGQGQG